MEGALRIGDRSASVSVGYREYRACGDEAPKGAG